MPHRYILTLDQGTSSLKTALWDDRGALVAEAAQAYPLQRPHPLWAQMDAELWWDAVGATVRQVIAASGAAPDAVAGIGVDGIGWTLVPVDAQVRPLYPAMTWLDRRAEAETEWLQALPNALALVELSANPLDPAYITPKLLWLHRHHPDVYDRTFQFLTASGFLVARLTGQFTCDYTQAYGFHCFDIRRRRWNPDLPGLQDLRGLDSKLPPLAPCTAIAGTLTALAAAHTGLHPGIPVLTGCLDAAVGALGAGVTRVGQTNEQGGQAGGMAISLDDVIVEPQLILSHHVLPGQYLLQGGTVGGGALGWFRDILGPLEANAGVPSTTDVSSSTKAPSGTSAFARLSALAATSPPGANGLLFLPYMAGERTPLWNSNARGVWFGLSYTSTRADLVRALMEGCAFAVYHNVHVAAQHGIQIDEYLGSGGATASAVWCQLKADIYGRPLVVARRADGGEGGHSLGLYALTAYALGWCDDIGACVERLLPDRRVYEPDPARHARYEELFAIYLNLSQKLIPDFDALAGFSKPLE